jgi:RNA polymerase sigma factor (sigma-70 family)
VEKYSDKIILIGIKNRKDHILEYLYREYFPKIKHIVISNGGNEQDARDLFQEALIIVFNRLKKNDLEIKSSFHNFFLVLCRFVWYRQNNLNRNHTLVENLDDRSAAIQDLETSSDFPGESYYREHLTASYEKIYQRHYRKLTGDCKKVLKMFFRKKPFREIAGRMGYASEDYARRKKYLCMQCLMKMITQDPEFIELKKTREHD